MAVRMRLQIRALGHAGRTFRQESKGPWQACGLADPRALGSRECAQSSELKNQLRADTARSGHPFGSRGLPPRVSRRHS